MNETALSDDILELTLIPNLKDGPPPLSSMLDMGKTDLANIMRGSDPEIMRILSLSYNLHDARDAFFEYLNDLERHFFNIFSDRKFKDLHILERNNAKECIRVLKNVIRTESERIAHFSALNVLFNIAKRKSGSLDHVTEGFLLEFIHLLNGINGRSGCYLTEGFNEEDLDHNVRSRSRSVQLDTYSIRMNGYFKRFDTGLDKDVIRKRSKNVKVILDHFGASYLLWNDHKWHLNNVITDLDAVSSIVSLSREEAEGLRYAERNDIPFQITPYYLSLFDRQGRSEMDRAIRAQVLPSVDYCKTIVSQRDCEEDMDFMGEKWTSPIEGITRRYPQILILKPYDSCPQICVYCQRNWEIKRIGEGSITKRKMEKAIKWIEDNQAISEVLVTGGDPLTLGDAYMDWILSRLSGIDHVERIRIGTRVPVTLPFRINRELTKILSRYHDPGTRELCFVTHFEHPTEVTPDSVKAISQLRKWGMSVYNQQVFTYYNSRRFESALLRKVLKLSGVDPYYMFNTKGKEETKDFRVPIARIEQERKEEARLLPGIVRTDEPVFNVPRLGKSHLRAWQDHEVIMIMPDGKRAYRFYPWESMLAICETYTYIDVPIRDYLMRLKADGEPVDEFRSIFYYF
jgi:lysine 2,3-aminomutase